jgi:hypothetical protein
MGRVGAISKLVRPTAAVISVTWSRASLNVKAADVAMVDAVPATTVWSHKMLCYMQISFRR